MAVIARFVLFLLVVLTVVEGVRAEPDFDKPVAAIGASDFRGRVWSLEDFKDADLLVVAYLGTECPLAKLYAGRLVALEQAYADRHVAVVGVISNRQDSIAEIAAFARDHQVKFPLLKDAGNRLADAMGAERTPEVFVLDRQRKIRYWGRIDDQYGIGYAKDEPETHDLRNAIDDLLAGRSPQVPVTRSVGCLVGRQKQQQPDATVNFTRDVSRILNRRCVECHREGEIAPFALTEYEEAAGWADMIAEVVREQRMPPWHANPAHGTFANDRSLTDQEKETLYAWADAGAPLGDPDDLPEPPTFLTGWQLPREPDVVIPVTPEPYEVPAEGEVRYQYFRFDPQWSEERWLAAAELQPGNRAVVHHILCFVRKKNSGERLQGERGFLVGYVPGARVEPFGPGMAKRVPADSELIFQVHYTPIGTPQSDQSKLGLVFADPKDVTQEVVTSSVVTTRFQIPPGEGNYRVDATIPERLPAATLLSFSPHMHLRGKSFTYKLVQPDGSQQILLDVPQYDFNWQTTYRLAEPLRIEEGSRIAGEAVFDNSDGNLNNPDPTATVRWGDQTWDEMMIGYFHYAVPKGAEPPKQADTEPSRQDAGAQRQRIFNLLDTDSDDRVIVAEIPKKYRDAAAALDRNADGVLTRQEIE
jgi:peroxiredoxin